MSLGSNIRNLNGGLTRDLLLDIQVIVLHVGSLDIAVEGEHVALEAIRWRARSRVQRAAGSNRVAGETRIKNRIRADVVVGRARIEKGRIREMAEHHVLGEGIEEHAESGPDYRLPFSSCIPCSADARGEVLFVRVIEAAQSRLAHLRKGEVTAGEIKTGNVA